MNNLSTDYISGFNDYSSYRFEGFTDRNMTDILSILNTISKDDRYQKMSTLLDTLRQHLLATDNAHDFDLTDMSAKVISTLYKLYRKHGYKGSVKDMLNAVNKEVKLGDPTDVAAGINDTKTETAVDFHKTISDHYCKEYAHRNISDTITPAICVTRYPYINIDRYSNQSIKLYNIDNLMIYGSILFEYWYNRIKNQGELFRVGFKEATIIFKATNTGIDVIRSTVLDDSIVLHLDYPKDSSINRYVFSFNEKGITLRDEINTVNSENYTLSYGSSLSLPDTILPIGNGSLYRRDGINRIAVYDYDLSDEEKTYLLN